MLKTNRNFIVMGLLSCITFGIYALLIPGKIAKAVNTACAGDGKKTRGFSVILLSCITFGIAGIIWCIKLLNRTKQFVDNNQATAETLKLKKSVGGMYIFINFIIFIGSLMYVGHFLRNVNNVCKIYNAQNAAKPAEEVVA